MRRWRKSTWALVIWTVLIFVWIAAGMANAGNAAQSCTGTDSAACQAGVGIGTGIGVTFLFVLWFVGFIVGTIVWFASRPKNNVVIYGPEGQQMTVSEKEAARRISQGWTYQRNL